MHRHTTVLLDAAEVLDGTSSCLTEKWKGHDHFARSPRILRVVDGLVVLQGSVKDILEPLHCL